MVLIMEARYERVLVIGDSYARDLGIFHTMKYSSGYLFVHGSPVEVYGKSGAKIQFVGDSLAEIPHGHYSVIVLICGSNDLCSADRSKAKRRKVETQTIAETWRKTCDKRNDSWAQEVRSRLEFFNNDLVAADAIYHKLCNSRFYMCVPKEAGNLSRGRPIKETATEAFKMVCKHLEDSCESELYTLSDLHKLMVDFIRAARTNGCEDNCKSTELNNLDTDYECPQDNDIEGAVDSEVQSFADMEYDLGSDQNNNVENVSPSDPKIEQTSPEFLAYSVDYLLSQLKTKYGEHIYVTELNGRKNVVCFKNFVSLIVEETWKQQQSERDGSEAERLVRNAARLIAAQIREAKSDMSVYPCTEDIVNTNDTVVPSLLRIFMECLVTDKLKCAGLSQALMQSSRPRTCMLPLPFALGVHLDRFGSSELIKEVSKLGFCISADEVNRFKQSVMQYDNQGQSFDATVAPIFHQFVADNVDHNVHTLDGSGSLHAMGIICATVLPSGSFGFSTRKIPRLTKRLLVSNVCKQQIVPISAFTEKPGSHVANVKFIPVEELKMSAPSRLVLSLNTIWTAGWLLADGMQPGWSGFMQSVSRGKHPPASCIDFLPIVNLPPTDVNCVYSTLLFIESQSQNLNIATPCVTFDQPLFLKAMDIALAKQLNVVIRLGAFHVLLSYLGSVGTLMRGSGLEEILSVLYGKNVVEQILQGRDYERAVRGHLIVYTALSCLLTNVLLPSDSDASQATVNFDNEHEVTNYKLDSEDIKALSELYENVRQRKVWLTSEMDDSLGCMAAECLQSDCVSRFETKMKELKSRLTKQSRTSRLWILYMKYIELLQKFLVAERTSDWLMHLECMYNMLGLFAVTGHLHYAKCVRLYLQQMKTLPESHPALYSQFLAGMHTIRRSDRYWAGLSCDLVIEQTLMKSVKSRGGLTHGRGVHDTVRCVWLKTMSEIARINSAISTLAGLHHVNNECVELGGARMVRDKADMQKVREYVTANSPFRFVDASRLISLSTGVSAGPEDGVTCDVADEIGYNLQQSWNNVDYGSVVVHKNSRVKTLANVHNLYKVDDGNEHIDANSLFHRLVVLVQRSDDQAACFEFELTPFPTALFKDGFMRKPDKPALYKEFAKNMTSEALPAECTFVVDGGCLLHRVRWARGTSALDILNLYVKYVKGRFGLSTVVVFDSYDCGPSIKDHEHLRRCGKISRMAPDVRLELTTDVAFDQEAFLANAKNKQQLIDHLSNFLVACNVEVVRSAGDADTEITGTALEIARCGTTAVVYADDTDVLALLISERSEQMAEIFFLSECRGKNAGRNAGKCISVGNMQLKLGTFACQHILLAHAFGGCDSTSAIFGIGKGTVLNRLTRK
jgi:hypothetical protein